MVYFLVKDDIVDGVVDLYYCVDVGGGFKGKVYIFD